MDLNEEEVASLFPDDRGTSFDNAEFTHWLSIERQSNGITITAGDDTYDVDQQTVEQMLDDCGWDSIWTAISEKDKCLAYVRKHSEHNEHETER